MNITPELIPHAEFHTGAWLRNTDNPVWYYFKKQDNNYSISDPSFIETVDTPLLELVKFLHQKNIRTTPSCAGHNHPKEHLAKIYDALLIDYYRIKSFGIVFKDVQTGELCYYCDSSYELPWHKEEFMDRLNLYQRKGILGMQIGDEKTKQDILSLDLTDAVTYSTGDLVFIHSHGTNKNPAQCWQAITRDVKKILS